MVQLQFSQAEKSQWTFLLSRPGKEQQQLNTQRRVALPKLEGADKSFVRKNKGLLRIKQLLEMMSICLTQTSLQSPGLHLKYKIKWDLTLLEFAKR